MIEFLALAQAPAYSLPKSPIRYELEVGFEGFIPILKGANGKAQVLMGISVQGLPAQDGTMRAAHEATRFRVTLNDAQLPFTLANVKPMLPRTEISLEPNGVVKFTTAPDRDLPVTLPGLDIKRFPEVSYLPIVLPQSAAVGTKWSFERSYSGYPMRYEAVIEKRDGALLEVGVAVSQTIKAKLNEFRIPMSEKQLKAGETPTFEATTSTTGKGVIRFDLQRGIALSSQVNLDSRTAFTGIVNDQAGEDRLKTSLRLTLVP